MGIKFHCPNGHQLNVKSFLAGKKGVCPKCGTKVRIPTVSEPGLDSDLEESEAAHGEHAKSNGSGAVAAQAVAPAPAAPGVAVAPAPHAAANTAVADDPIAEAPSAIWYVRPPTGGQYGPARGDIMRKWISEGRVSSDSLVWREGWTDWQNAGKLFPMLNEAGSHTAAQAAAPTVSTTVPHSAKSSQRAVSPFDNKRRDSNALAVAILVSLGILCLILIATLIFVVTRMNQTS